MELHIALFLLISFFGIFSAIFWLLLILWPEKNKKPRGFGRYLPITVLIPAKNAARYLKIVLKNLEVQKATYPGRVSVVVVDDGSTDATSEIARSFGARVLKTPGIGKAAALNLALKKVRTPLIAIWDADTILTAGGLRKLVEKLLTEGAAAVSSATFPWAPRRNLLFKLQEMEYVVGNETKNALGKFHLHSIISGAVSVAETAAVKAVGGFPQGFLTEDFALGILLLLSGRKTTYCIDAKAYTAVPLTLSAWIRQRLRWFRGRIEVIFRYLPEIIRSGDLAIVTLFDLMAFSGIVGTVILILRTAIIALKSVVLELYGKILSGKLLSFEILDLQRFVLKLKYFSRFPLYTYFLFLIFLLFLLFLSDRKQRRPIELLAYIFLYTKALLMAWILSFKAHFLGEEKKW